MLRGKPWALLGKDQVSLSHVTIMRMHPEIEEMRQVLMANNLKMFTHRDGKAVKCHRCESSQVRGLTSWRSVPASRANSSVDPHHALNAKQNRREGDLRTKLIVKATATTRSIFPARSEARTPRSAQMEKLLPSGHLPSKPEIEDLERQCHGIPLKFCHVDHGRASFFSFNTVELPVLP
ncbi:hypothetical protein Acr_03g0015290 [Actinidia rufa]|uniref:Uncharacterized protein n=1 Tax=Actinidia rufa TaxID=165716 RepID=A0A7J0EE76_9ERIC|nr:hypothetical protein Acr_03g0015290 [Actinidia rufa]